MEAEPIVQSLGRWAARSPAHDPTLPLSGTSLMLSFRTMFDPDRAEGLDASYEFRLGEDRFRAEVAEGRLEIERGTAEQPDAMVETEAGTLAALVYDELELDDVLSSGDLRISGDRAAVERFLTLFPLPEPAAVGV
jgi:alkyl sulfatase BDS1-like metallo-beta-lactamase superfamily hydrolase